MEEISHKVLVKVCGMRHADNVEQLASLPIDIVGFIFYPKSPRYVGAQFNLEIRNSLPPHIAAAGVFVNEDVQEVIKLQSMYTLDYLQIHGNETYEYCEQLQCKTTAKIVKAFQVDEEFDFQSTRSYEHACDFFLFDTKTAEYGGSGKKYDWKILDNYTGVTPFFLSGGITVDDIAEISALQHAKLYSIDINSKFEIQPGLKDIERVKTFISLFRKK